MKAEQQIIEVMSELLAEVHEMRLEITGMRGDFKGLQNEQKKTNLQIQEFSLSVMKLADFGERIFLLEKEVLKKHLEIFYF